MAVSRRSLLRTSLVAAPFLFGEMVLPVRALGEVPNADPINGSGFPVIAFA